MIRPALPEDGAALAALLAELGYATTPDEIPGRLRQFREAGRGEVLVAAGDGSLLGAIAVELTAPIHHPYPVGHISALVVAETARGRGIGRDLLTAAEGFARQRGCRSMVVTSAERRADAHAFYTALGWDYTGRRFGRGLAPNGQP